MKSTTKCISKWATAIVALAFAASLAPISKAGDPPAPATAAADAQPAPPAAAPADTQQRLQDLEKQVEQLQEAIASLKASNAAHLESAAYAQPSAGSQPAAPAPEEKINLGNLLGSTTFSGFVDTYYQFNANHPFNNDSGWRFFDQKTNTFSLNMAELIVDHPPDASSTDARFGFHVAAGYGQAAAIVNGSDIAAEHLSIPGEAIPAPSNFYLKEAYGSYLAPIGKGLKIDVGKFVTQMGNEVIETNANWNYSRGLLFYYAIPYFHFGGRATYTFNPHWQVIGLIVNGWNNSFIDRTAAGTPFSAQGLGVASSGLTYHGELVWTPTTKWSVTGMYMAGPVIDAYRTTSSGATKAVTDWKQLSDTIISFTPNSKWSFALDGDYGFGPRTYNCVPPPGAVTEPRPQVGLVFNSCPPANTFSQNPAVKWWGVAGYAKYNFSPKSYFATRYEYYGDPNGYSGLLSGENGYGQEVTGTYAYNLTSGLQARGEYRYDFAHVPIFLDGSNRLVKEQNTVTLGIIYSFNSPAPAK